MGARALFFLFLISAVFAVCPPGTTYESLYNKCYKFVTQPAKFDAAEKSCESLGGSLVSITNAFENAYLAGLVETTLPPEDVPSASYWIGLKYYNATGYDGTWYWINGDTSIYTNFDIDWHVVPSLYQCAAVGAYKNSWLKDKCSESHMYICQVPPSGAPITPAPGSCPEGRCPDPTYILNPDACKCYKYYSNPSLTFNNSAAACAREDSTLAIILNEAENRFIASYVFSLPPSKPKAPWIGLWCMGTTPESCRWIDGSPVTYSNFENKYPMENEPAYMDERTEKWSTFPNDEGTYVCQQKGIPASTMIQQLRGKPFLPNKLN